MSTPPAPRQYPSSALNRVLPRAPVEHLQKCLFSTLWYSVPFSTRSTHYNPSLPTHCASVRRAT